MEDASRKEFEVRRLSAPPMFCLAKAQRPQRPHPPAGAVPCAGPNPTYRAPASDCASLWPCLGGDWVSPSLFWRGWGVGLWVVLGVGLLIGCSIWCTRKYRRTRQIQCILVFKTKTKKTLCASAKGLDPQPLQWQILLRRILALTQRKTMKTDFRPKP